jgi:hypothetical protein
MSMLMNFDNITNTTNLPGVPDLIGQMKSQTTYLICKSKETICISIIFEIKTCFNSINILKKYSARYRIVGFGLFSSGFLAHAGRKTDKNDEANVV